MMNKTQLVTALALFFLPMMATAEGVNTSHVAKASIINNANEVIGMALFRQLDEGVEISVMAHSLSAGAHGIHLHEHGTCKDTESFKLSGGHIMHEDRPHGLHHPDGPDAGDLENLMVRDDGTAFYRYVNARVSLHGTDDLPALVDEDLSALIIHEHADDHKSQPIGGAGKRIACAEIGVISSQ